MPSAPSSFNLGIESLEFSSRIVDLKLPVNPSLILGRLLRPDADLGAKELHVTYASAAQALARHATEFACGNIEPTAVFRGVTKRDATHVIPCLLRFKRLVESPLGVGVQVVAPSRHPFIIHVACIEQMGHFLSPICLRSPFTSARLTKPRKRFGKHEDTRGA
jgi:hypothetical protein